MRCLPALLIFAALALLAPASASAAPELAMSLTGTGPVFGGAVGGIRVRINNTGTDSSGPVTVTGTLPDVTQYAGATGSGWTCTPGQTFTCTYAASIAAAGRAEDLNISLSASAVGFGDVTTTLSGGGDITPFNNTDTKRVDVGYARNWAVSARKDSFGQPVVGAPAAFEVNVRKAGAADLSGPLTLTGSLGNALTPGAITGTGWSCQGGAQFTCTPTSRSWDKLAVSVTPTPLAFPSTRLSVQIATVGDQNPADDVASAELTVLRADDAIATFSQSATKVRQGGKATITVGASNLGRGAAATPSTVTVTLPPFITPIEAKSTGTAKGDGVTCQFASPMVCTFPKGTGTAKVVAKASRSAPVGAAQITAALTRATDEDPANNAAALTWNIACCPPKAKTRALQLSTSTPTVALTVGDKLVIRSKGRRWRVRSKPAVLSSGRSSGNRRARKITFTATRAGSGTVRLTQRRGARTIRRAVKVTVAP